MWESGTNSMKSELMYACNWTMGAAQVMVKPHDYWLGKQAHLHYARAGFGQDAPFAER